MPSVLNLLTLGNTKVGESIPVWSIPAVDTCPGSTETCRAACYATKSRYLLEGVQNRLRWNLGQANRDDFADRMVREVRRKGALAVRVHSSGDFFSAAYARKWQAVFKGCPNTKFWAYSRSYRCPDIWAVLRGWGKVKNVRLWLSADKDTGMPEDVPEGIRVCWLQTEVDEEIPASHLVFRVRRLRRFQPRIGLRVLPVCPNEIHDGRSDEVTCGSCQRCFR